MSRSELPSELRPVGCRAGRGAQEGLGRQARRHGRARVPGASVGDAGHVGDAYGSRADEAEPQLQPSLGQVVSHRSFDNADAPHLTASLGGRFTTVQVCIRRQGETCSQVLPATKHSHSG